MSSAQVAKKLSEPDRMTRLELESGLGATGRPLALQVVKPREPKREHHRLRPHGRRPADWSKATADAWWRNTAIEWDGAGLVLTDAKGAAHSFRAVTSRSEPTAEDRSTAARTVAEIVWFTEQRDTDPSRPARRRQLAIQVLFPHSPHRQDRGAATSSSAMTRLPPPMRRRMKQARQSRSTSARVRPKADARSRVPV